MLNDCVKPTIGRKKASSARSTKARVTPRLSLPKTMATPRPGSIIVASMGRAAGKPASASRDSTTKPSATSISHGGQSEARMRKSSSRSRAQQSTGERYWCTVSQRAAPIATLR